MMASQLLISPGFASLVVQGMNPSVQRVYSLLRFGRMMKVGQIEDETSYSDRTVRKALAKLRKLNLIRKVPDMHDLRSHFYVSTA
ncbi:MAG: hypothetical protein ACXADA_22565 [Candidatus Hodarchaeales archaeon]|jgi:DNA-binding transcriptional regulator GbsR (MarR family)